MQEKVKIKVLKEVFFNVNLSQNSLQHGNIFLFNVNLSKIFFTTWKYYFFFVEENYFFLM